MQAQVRFYIYDQYYVVLMPPKCLLETSSETVALHPLSAHRISCAAIAPSDLLKFIASTAHAHTVVEF